MHFGKALIQYRMQGLACAAAGAAGSALAASKDAAMILRLRPREAGHCSQQTQPSKSILAAATVAATV